MGMDLYQGGHLTHGSGVQFLRQAVSRVSYGVSPRHRRLDYDEIRDLARQHRPKGDHRRLHFLPLGARLGRLSPRSPTRSGAAAGRHRPPGRHGRRGRFPNPCRDAHVITSSPRTRPSAAPAERCILTTDEELAQAIDMAVFPGEQGGPHPTSSRPWRWPSRSPATSRSSACMWRQEERGCSGRGLQRRGLRLAYGGTDTHFC
jgi:glycine hydroxymethyltransferase